MNRLFAAFMVMALVFGCGQKDTHNTPEGLVGTWKTSAARYEHCSIEIGHDFIIFRNDPDFVNINLIQHIETQVENNRILYRIFYGDVKGNEDMLALFFI
jgi:uncharacterized protein (UPF0218 family)